MEITGLNDNYLEVEGIRKKCRGPAQMTSPVHGSEFVIDHCHGRDCVLECRTAAFCILSGASFQIHDFINFPVRKMSEGHEAVFEDGITVGGTVFRD